MALPVEEMFWESIDSAQKEWDFQIRLKPEELEMEEPMKSVYLSERLIFHLSNILSLAKMMKRDV